MSTRRRIEAALVALSLGTGTLPAAAPAGDAIPLARLRERDVVVTHRETAVPIVRLDAADTTHFHRSPADPWVTYGTEFFLSVVESAFPPKAERRTATSDPAEAVADWLSERLGANAPPSADPLRLEIEVVDWDHVIQNHLRVRLGGEPRYKPAVGVQARLVEPSSSEVLWQATVSCAPDLPRGQARTLRQLRRDPRSSGRYVELAAPVCAGALWQLMTGEADTAPVTPPGQ